MNWIQNKTISLREFPPGARYLVGVSGGRDSVALLHWLVSGGFNNLIVCHLNHQLRGRASDADAHFVEKLADKYDLELEFGSTNVRALARGKLDGFKPSSFKQGKGRVQRGRKKMSIETAGREARYAFFAKVARRCRCRTIFLAHHADDLVETFLLNLFRGAGTTGLSAMRPVSKRRVAGVDLSIVRPLLGVWRSEIDQYIREHRLKFREDASNKSLTPLRNRIRHRIIPYLEKTIDRNIRRNIWRAATILADEDTWIEHQLSDSNGVDLSVAQLKKLPTALQRREIARWLRRQNISNIGFEAIERVRSLLDNHAHVAKVNLPQDRHARRRAKTIFIDG